MGRLFWKIFGWYWLAAVTLVVLGAWATYQIASWSADRDSDRSLAGRPAVRAAVRAQAHLQAVAARLAEGDLAAARELLGGRPEHVFVLDGTGAELLGRGLPPGARAVLSGSRSALPAAERWLIESVGGPRGERYTVLGHLAPPGEAELLRPGRASSRSSVLRPWLGSRHWREYWWIRLAVALLVSGLVCYLLARHLAGPVQRLRSATRRVSAGDLSVRVGASLGERRDEIADLARDFDTMTERLGALVAGQQRLLRDIAHELRSPLARLRVALELARQRARGSAAAEHDRIELETERLSALIGQILELEQLNQPIAEERAETVDLADIVREVADDAAFEAQARGVTVACHIAAEPRVRGQSSQVRSAIENVVRNACSYSPAGSTVAVALDVDSRAGEAQVRVRDAGPGVPEDALAHLFEPFYRVDSARSREQGGHGLGLAIAERIARRHRGAISAANRPGGGLEVTLRLPVQTPHR